MQLIFFNTIPHTDDNTLNDMIQLPRKYDVEQTSTVRALISQ